MTGFVFPQIQQLDLMGSLQAAEQIRSNRLQQQVYQQNLLQKQNEIRRTTQFQSLLGPALQGNQQAMASLQTEFPLELAEFNKSYAQAKEAEQKQQVSARENTTSLATNGLRLADLQGRTPTAWAAVRPSLGHIAKQMGLNISLPENAPTKDELGAIQQQLQAVYRANAVLEPQTAEGKYAADLGHIPGTQPYAAVVVQKEAKEEAGKNYRARASRPTTIVNTGNIVPTTAAQTDLQKDLILGQSQLQELNNIYRYTPELREHLGIPGKLKTALQTGVDYFKEPSPQQAKRIQKQSKFRSDIGKYYAQEKIANTGLNAAMQEQANYEKEIPNWRMSVNQFIGSVQASSERIKRGNRLRINALREGISGGGRPTKDEINKAANTRWEQGDEGNSDRDRAARLDELIKDSTGQGVAPKDAVVRALNQMALEGYISDDEIAEAKREAGIQ